MTTTNVFLRLKPVGHVVTVACAARLIQLIRALPDLGLDPILVDGAGLSDIPNRNDWLLRPVGLRVEGLAEFFVNVEVVARVVVLVADRPLVMWVCHVIHRVPGTP